jgi:hypothetical protein
METDAARAPPVHNFRHCGGNQRRQISCIDGFLKLPIRGLILLAALIANVYARRLRAESPKG